MTRIILVTFCFLGWAWFEMSGGRDFEPGNHSLAVLAPFDAQPAPKSERVAVVSTKSAPAPEPEVTRTSGMGTSLADVSNLSIVSFPAQNTQPEPEKVAAVIASDPVPAAVVIAASSIDYRLVTGTRVNLRSGPGTGFDVVAKLLRGDKVEVLQDEDSGWVRLRTLRGSDVGWMSDTFLASAD